MDDQSIPPNEPFRNDAADPPQDDWVVISAASWADKPLPAPNRWHVEGWSPVERHSTQIFGDGMNGQSIKPLTAPLGARDFRVIVHDWLEADVDDYLVAVCTYYTTPYQVLRIARRVSPKSAKFETWLPPAEEPIFSSRTLSELLRGFQVPKGEPLILGLAQVLCTNPERATVLGWTRHWG